MRLPRFQAAWGSRLYSGLSRSLIVEKSRYILPEIVSFVNLRMRCKRCWNLQEEASESGFPSVRVIFVIARGALL